MPTGYLQGFFNQMTEICGVIQGYPWELLHDTFRVPALFYWDTFRVLKGYLGSISRILIGYLVETSTGLLLGFFTQITEIYRVITGCQGEQIYDSLRLSTHTSQYNADRIGTLLVISRNSLSTQQFSWVGSKSLQPHQNPFYPFWGSFYWTVVTHVFPGPEGLILN